MLPLTSQKQRKPSRLYLRYRRHRRQFWVGVVVFVFVVYQMIKALSVGGRLRWVIRYRDCYAREAGVVWREAPIADLERPCTSIDYQIAETPQKICMTTLTDRQSKSFSQRFWRCRNFDAINTFANHQNYASRHNYVWRDGSDMIDPSRPPAWSKIKAVEKLMSEAYRCDWIWWIDADAVIMKSDVRLEGLLPADPNVHLIATHDRKFTYNSGSWLIRNSAWSKHFLETWWNQREHVMPAGASLSGDNMAFGQVLTTNPKINSSHAVKKVPRCAMNSFAVFVKQNELPFTEERLRQQEWYLSDMFYHKGDFVAHASAVDKKSEAVDLLLEHST